MTEGNSRVAFIRWLTIAAVLLCLAGTVRAADQKAARPDADQRRERAARAGNRPEAGEGARRAEAGGERRKARDPGAGGGAMRQRLEDAIAELNLAPEQKEQLKPIREEIRAKLQELRGQLKDLSPQDRRERIKEVLTEVRGKLEAILTDEQKTKLREKLQNLRDGAKQGERKVDRPNAAPSTEPSAQLPPAGAGRGVMIDRLRENLDKLELTPDQDKKVEAILADASKQLIKLREDAAGNLDGLRDKAREVFTDVRGKLRDVLTAEQQRKLLELMPPRRPDGPPSAAPETKPPVEKIDQKSTASAEPTMGEGGTMSAQQSQGTSKTNTNVAPVKPGAVSLPARSSVAAKLVIGQPAPPFRLARLDGRQQSLTNFNGKPLVLVFGSFSSPTFRDKAPMFEAMKKALRNKAAIVIVYTREAYPADEWDVQRNLDEQISIKQSATIEDRMKLAKDTRDGLKLSIDVLVDDIDDGVATVYEALPNGAVVIDANGKLIGHQKWADPHGLSLMVDDALKAK